MPLRNQTDPTRIQPILRLIFSQPRPPVARCRLLSSGFGPSYMLKTSDDLVGSKACLGCGCCIDACPVNIDITEVLQHLTEVVYANRT